MNGELVGWALIAACIFAAAGIHNRKQIRAWFNRPGINLDDLDQRIHTTAGRCPNCRRDVTGLAWVIVTEEFGGGLDRVCHGCSGIGLYKGWYRAQLPSTANVYDIAAAHEAGDLDDIDDIVRKWSAS